MGVTYGTATVFLRTKLHHWCFVCTLIVHDQIGFTVRLLQDIGFDLIKSRLLLNSKIICNGVYRAPAFPS